MAQGEGLGHSCTSILQPYLLQPVEEGGCAIVTHNSLLVVITLAAVATTVRE